MPPELINPDDQAAYVIAETLAKLLLDGARDHRTFLYCWERDSIEWLRAWQNRTTSGILNAWTASYLRGEIAGCPAD